MSILLLCSVKELKDIAKLKSIFRGTSKIEVLKEVDIKQTKQTVKNHQKQVVLIQF